MQAVNTQTLVHVGVELVVIGGLTFWFQRKTSLLQEEIDQLRNKVSKYEGVIDSQGQLLAKHDQILRSLLGGQVPNLPNNQHGFIPSPKGSQSGQKGGPPPPAVPHGGSFSSNRSSYPSHPPSRHPPPPQEDDTEPDLPPEELDKLIQEELGVIGKTQDPEFIEIECNEDSCELKESSPKSISSQLKKKNRRRGRGEKLKKK